MRPGIWFPVAMVCVRWVLAFALILIATLPSGGALSAETELPKEKVSEVFAKLREKALRKSYDLRIAEAGERQASAARYTSWTRWIPHVDLSLTQSRNRDYSITTSGAIGQIGFLITPQALSLARWDLDVTFPVYRRSVHIGVGLAAAESDLSRERVRSRRTEIDWRVRQALGNYLLQSYKEKALETSIRLARTNRREAELRFELGQRTRVDLLKSRANVISLDSKREQYRQERTAALNQLREYVGVSIRELKDTGLDGLLGSEESIYGAIADFSESRGALQSLEAYLEGEDTPFETEKQVVSSSPVYGSAVSEESLAMQRARDLNSAEYPELLLRGNINKQAPNWPETLRSGQISYSVALVLKVPIFSGFSSLSSYREKANAQIAAALSSEKDLVRFRGELETDRTRIRSLRSQLEAFELNREQNEEIVRLSEKSYRLGKANLLELLTAQDDLIEAKIELAQARIDLAVLARKYAWNLGATIP